MNIKDEIVLFILTEKFDGDFHLYSLTQFMAEKNNKNEIDFVQSCKNYFVIISFPLHGILYTELLDRISVVYWYTRYSVFLCMLQL